MAIAIDPGDAPTLEQPLATLVGRTADVARIKLQRPNDTNAYGAGDVLGTSTAAGGATVATGLLTFTFPKLAGVLGTLANPIGGELLITSTMFSREASAVASGETSYNLYLFKSIPTNFNDNAAWDIAVADLQILIGKVGLGTPVDEGTILLIRTEGINQQVTVLSNTIYGYLVTVGGYTPVANTVVNLEVHAAAL